MPSRTIFAIDAGSHSLKGLAANINPKKEAIEILAKVEAPSSGIKNGLVVDVDDASRAISLLIDQLEAILERDIKEVVVSVGGPQIETRFVKGTVVVSRADEEIGKEDVERAIQAAESTSLPQNRILLHIIPRSFLIDEQDRVKDPIGMRGTRLSCEALVIDTLSPTIRQLEKCFNAIGVIPSSMVSSILAGSWATVPKKERDLGVCAIDLGAETTTMTVFEEGQLIHANIIPIGSRHVTGDIASALKIHFDDAEKIKLGAGHAFPGHVSRKDTVQLSDFVSGAQESISKRYLAEIIEARIAEIFELVVAELKRINRIGKLPGGAILFGGGSKIPDIDSLAKHELKLASRIANLEHYRKLFPEGIEIQYYQACGLVLWAADSILNLRKQQERGFFRALKHLFRAFLP
ncbi:MAG: cell division protein FtsA [Candidatus Paceibacteria bacterium]